MTGAATARLVLRFGRRLRPAARADAGTAYLGEDARRRLNRRRSLRSANVSGAATTNPTASGT